ncbi:MAG: Rieske 2Fe-2S domain-containing protein [Candidatus Anammoxibacter sp.]
MDNAIVYMEDLTKVGNYQYFPVDCDYRDCFVIRLKGPLCNGLKISDNSGDELVAFHKKCTHMGWVLPLAKDSNQPHILGPCPGHLTSFDLSKGGMVVIGQATECLPQVKLKYVNINNGVNKDKEAVMYYGEHTVPYGLTF